MNFFEQQDQSRRQTRRLIVLFVLAVLVIIAVIDVVLLFVFGVLGSSAEQAGQEVAVASATQIVLFGSIVTASVIGLSSLGRTVSLRGGGGKVARDLGGVRIESGSGDPLKRRLVNVVEEIALASGVPMPEIYVLEHEEGINAFAAGYSPSDAAVAVTRGTLEKLSRSELQGVIAHEFSHVLNGDMRLNIRLMGALFGILVLAIIGRRVLIHARFAGSSRDKGGVAILAIAAALTLLGYIGLFFGRWIKAAVSRQREYLADASAVQFTRDPQGIGGALKKIALGDSHSYLKTDTEEVGHMLFGAGRPMAMFATHPPILDRIRRIEPDFVEDELKTLARRAQRDESRLAEKQQRAAAEPASRPGIFDARNIIDNIGHPDLQQILLAAAVAGAFPEPVQRAAHEPERAVEVLLYSLLHENSEVREAQLLAVAETMGTEVESRVNRLEQMSGPLPGEQCWPLLEIILPGLRRQTPETLTALAAAADRMAQADGLVSVFEFLVLRLMKTYVREAVSPHLARPSGRKSLRSRSQEVAEVLAVLARHGHLDSVEAAGRAFDAGYETAYGQNIGMPSVNDWLPVLDKALDRLDALSPKAKQVLVQAMVATVNADQQWITREVELMRAICASLHIPLPMMTAEDTQA